MKARTKAFGLRTLEAPERVVLDAVLRYLATDRRVVWFWRFNVGAMRHDYTRKDGTTGTSYVRFGFPGCSDILGQLTDGRTLAVETKKADGRTRPDQLAFLGKVEDHGGVAVLARSVNDVKHAIDAAFAAAQQRLERQEPRQDQLARQQQPGARHA